MTCLFVPPYLLAKVAPGGLAVDEGGLAVVDVGDDRDVAEVGASGGHAGAVVPSWCE